MKKTIILAALFAATAFAGEEVIPAPTPAPVPAAAPSNFTLEIAGAYNFATRDLYRHVDYSDVDTWGIDLTGIWALDANNAVTLRFGYAWGESDVNYTDWTQTFSSNSFYLMPGYRYTQEIASGVKFFAGVNAGLDIETAKIKEEGFGDRWTAKDTSWGFAYSAELGLTFDLTDDVYLLAAYQFSGSTAKPILRGDGWEQPSRRQYYHGVRVGVGCKF